MSESAILAVLSSAVAVTVGAVALVHGRGGLRTFSPHLRTAIVYLGALAAFTPAALVLWAKNLPAWQYAGIGVWGLLWLLLAPGLAGLGRLAWRERRQWRRVGFRAWFGGGRKDPEIIEATLVGGLPVFSSGPAGRIPRRRRRQLADAEIERMVAERTGGGVDSGATA